MTHPTRLAASVLRGTMFLEHTADGRRGGLTRLLYGPKVIEAPGISSQDKSALPKLNAQQLSKLVKVKAYKEGDKTIIEVEGQPVEEQNLELVLSRLVSPQRDEVLFDARDVEWGTLVTIQDAAKAAGFRKGHFKMSPKAPPK